MGRCCETACKADGRGPNGIWPPTCRGERELRRIDEGFEGALRVRGSFKERHLAQFQARKKTKTEGWAEFADAVKLLCDKAYPDLEEKARECLALNHYLSQIDNPQVALSVQQRDSPRH